MSDAPVSPDGEPRRGKRLGRQVRRLRTPLICFAVLAVAVVAYNGVTGWMAARLDARVPRDSQTGIMLGAEPQTLGPDGARTAVLLVHGFIGAGNNFGELPNRLAAEGYRVRVMLLPGHGTSPKDLAETPPDAMIAAVLDEIRALRDAHEKVVVVGHSMGGALATLAATTEHVDGLVLAAPYFGVTYQWYYVLPPEWWTRLSAPFIRRVYKSDRFIRVKRAEVKDEIVSYRWVPAHGSKMLAKFGALARDPDILEFVECPLLMIVARDDFAASPRRAAEAYEHVNSENKRLVWLENSDHHVFWDYEREQAIEEVRAFVRRIDSTEGN